MLTVAHEPTTCERRNHTYFGGLGPHSPKVRCLSRGVHNQEVVDQPLEGHACQRESHAIPVGPPLMSASEG